MENINYQFTQVPTKLMILLDVNCRSMLFTLCQLASHYADKNGIFFRTNADLSAESRLSQKLVIATIDTLYTHGIVEIWSVGIIRKSNFSPNPKRSVPNLGFRLKRSVQKSTNAQQEKKPKEYLLLRLLFV